jgi:uncharacterized lipoprotein YbaY
MPVHKTMKSKFVIFCLAALGVVVLAGCGSKEEEATPAPAPTAAATAPAPGQAPAAGQPAPPQETSNQGGEFIQHGNVTL